MSSRWARSQEPRNQLALFSPTLDDALPGDHPMRLLDVLLRDLDWSKWEAVYEGDRGRPPVHPRLMAGCILYGLANRIRSLRDLEDATRYRVDFLWFLEGLRIDHSTFGDFKNRFADKLPDLLVELGRRTRELAKASSAPTVAVDGTCIRANSDRQGARTAEWLREHLAQIGLDLASLLAREDDGETEELRRRIEQCERERARCEAALAEAARRDEAKRRTQGKSANEVRVPVTDPDSTVLKNKDGGFAPNFTPTAAVDCESGAVLDADVANGGDEAKTVAPAVERIGEKLGTDPARVLADGNFAEGKLLAELSERGVEACMPVRGMGSADNPADRPDPEQPVPEELLDSLPRYGGKFARWAFVYDAENDRYLCPAGRPLPRYREMRNSGRNRDTTTVEYRCRFGPECPLRERCVKGKAKCRTVSRDEFSPYIEETAKRMRQPEQQRLYRRRAPVVEGVFAHIKAIMGIRSFLTRGLERVRAEWQWICCALNLKKLLRTAAPESERTECPPDGPAKRNQRQSGRFRGDCSPCLPAAA